MSKYLNLAIGARRRLDILRRDAAQLNERLQKLPPHDNPPPRTWRDVRYCGFKVQSSEGQCQGLNDGKPIWYMHSDLGMRHKFADEIRPLGHTGWFADAHDFDTVRGLVVYLSHGRCLAGHYQKDPGETVIYPRVFDDACEAATWADWRARRQAEAYRQDDYKQMEAQQLQESIEARLDRLKECLALRNNKCFAYLRDEARQVMEAIRKERRELETEYANYI